MIKGSQADMARRIKALLPTGWFGDGTNTPNLDAVLQGLGYGWAFIYDMLAYIRLQTRVATATGVFLDIVALDFLGRQFPRNQGESDFIFRLRIQREILRPKVTRSALKQALIDLTGQEPLIFEPANTTDTGGYNLGGISYNGNAGGYGSLAYPYQCFVTAYRPHVGGIPSVDGYNGTVGGFGEGSIEYSNRSQIIGAVEDSDIEDAILSVIPAATVVWLRITNLPPVIGGRLDIDFILDESHLS